MVRLQRVDGLIVKAVVVTDRTADAYGRLFVGGQPAEFAELVGWRVYSADLREEWPALLAAGYGDVLTERAVVDFLRHLLVACETEARQQGWVGDWAPTKEDCEAVCDRLRTQAGRWPTRAEWVAVGWPGISDAHTAGGPCDPDQGGTA